MELLARVVRKKELLRFAIEAGDFAAVQFVEQVIRVIADEIDEMAVESFLFGERARFGYGGFRELWIAIALLGEAAQEGCGIVVDFLAQDFIDGHGQEARQKNRGRGASACSGSHCGYIGGKQNQETRGSAARSSRSDIDGNRNRRIEDGMEEVGPRIAKATGSIHSDEDERGVAIGGIDEAFVDVGCKDRFDFAIESQLEHEGLRVIGGRDGGLCCEAELRE